MNEEILILLMGGPMDVNWGVEKVHACQTPISDYFDYLEKTIVAPFEVRNPNVWSVRISCKDTAETKIEDIWNLIDQIKKISNNKIIVIHDISDIGKTARDVHFAMEKEEIKKTIVFTGSHAPLKGYSPSDAPFNLGYAFAKAQDLEEGVYICLNQQTYDTDMYLSWLQLKN